MKKSAIVTTVLTVLLLGAGIGLIVFGLTSQPQVVRYQDDWSFFSWSYSYYSTDSFYQTERLFNLGRTLVTCGIVMLGFTFVLSDTKKSPKKKDPKNSAKTECHEAHYENVGPKVTPESAKPEEAPECRCCSDEHKVPDPDQVIQL